MMYPTALTKTGLYFFVMASALLAQQEEQQQKQPPTKGKIKIVQLNHVDADDAARAISSVGVPLRVSALDGNRLVLHGPAMEIETVVAELIPAMDAPQVGTESEAQTHLIPLNTAPTGVLLNLLETATAGSRTRFAIDHDNRLLVAKAGPSELEAIRKVVAQLDRETPSLTLEFFFIRGSITARQIEGANNLPKSLTGVSTALNETGLSNLTLLAPVLVRTDSRNEFRSQGVKKEKAGKFEQLNLMVRGVARLQSDGKTVQLDVRADLDGSYELTKPNDETNMGETYFNVNTTITTRLGEYVVLAASPGTTAEGDAVALAVRVTSDDARK